jgi:phosphoesterase RecJ-like protein
VSQNPQLRHAARIIAEADSLAMVCHIGPDGDALGSMLGMALAAQHQGRAVYPSFGEPFVIPETYRYLPLDLLVPPSSVPATPDVMISFDAGSIDRLGNLQPNAEAAREMIVIDHHISNTGFGDCNVIVPDAAATAEIVFDLLGELGWPIGEDVATSLHTGIVTDTGRFQYSNTTPRTLEVASALVAAGARPEVIGQHVYEEVPFGYLAVSGVVLERAQLDPAKRFVWSVLTQADLDAGGIGLDDTDPLIDAIRVAREADVAGLFKVLSDNRVKGSLRSRGRVDVGAIAVALGGGGHHNAAGFNFDGTADEAVAAVRERLAAIE